jgi:hypothetical protein
MDRIVEPEWLDRLPSDDPRAAGSRRDLQRVNRLMGHSRILADQILRSIPMEWPSRWHMADLGAGDGVFALRLLRRLPSGLRPRTITLVDRVALVDDGTFAAFAELDCEPALVQADAFEWLESTPSVAMISANLFLHHFADERLAKLMELIAGRCVAFVACEPRRSWLPFRATRLLRFIGCNEVTRFDAVASVRAGFARRELSRQWPNSGAWRIEEGPAGLFSHVFAARSVPDSISLARNRRG